MIFKSETIAAIATALNDSGIGIIRVSGDESIEIVNKIYRKSLITSDFPLGLRLGEDRIFNLN